MPCAPRTHRVLHGALHGTTEHDPAFELLGDRIGDQLRVGFGLADFLDVNVDRHTHAALQFRLQQLDVLALLANHHTWTRTENRDARILGRTLDDDATNRSIFEFLLQELANADVFFQHAREIGVVRVPTRTPITGDGQTEASRMYFLTHRMTP